MVYVMQKIVCLFIKQILKEEFAELKKMT